MIFDKTKLLNETEILERHIILYFDIFAPINGDQINVVKQWLSLGNTDVIIFCNSNDKYNINHQTWFDINSNLFRNHTNHVKIEYIDYTDIINNIYKYLINTTEPGKYSILTNLIPIEQIDKLIDNFNNKIYEKYKDVIIEKPLSNSDIQKILNNNQTRIVDVCQSITNKDLNTFQNFYSDEIIDFLDIDENEIEIIYNSIIDFFETENLSEDLNVYRNLFSVQCFNDMFINQVIKILNDPVDIKHKQINELVDILNIYISIRSGKIMYGLSKDHIINKGSYSLSLDDILDKVSKNKTYKEEISSCINQINNLFSNTLNTIKDVFENGEHWVEIKILLEKDKKKLIFTSNSEFIYNRIISINNRTKLFKNNESLYKRFISLLNIIPNNLLLDDDKIKRKIRICDDTVKKFQGILTNVFNSVPSSSLTSFYDIKKNNINEMISLCLDQVKPIISEKYKNIKPGNIDEMIYKSIQNVYLENGDNTYENESFTEIYDIIESEMIQYKNELFKEFRNQIINYVDCFIKLNIEDELSNILKNKLNKPQYTEEDIYDIIHSIWSNDINSEKKSNIILISKNKVDIYIINICSDSMFDFINKDN